MSYTNDSVTGGIDILQDIDSRLDIGYRSVRFGVKIVSRDNVGDLVADPLSLGDHRGWILWNQIPGARPTPAWAQVWATRVAVAPQTGSSGDQYFPFSITPISTFLDYDARWGGKTVLMGRFGPGSQRPIWNLPARGAVGIAVACTNENQPDEMFLPTDPRMIAVNNRGVGAMGSVVCDLADDNSYDQTRYARLQTMMRVVPLGQSFGIEGFRPDPYDRDGAMLGVIAWNHALTGVEGALGRGAVFDQVSGSMPPPPDPRPPVPTPRPIFRDEPTPSGGGGGK